VKPNKNIAQIVIVFIIIGLFSVSKIYPQEKISEKFVGVTTKVDSLNKLSFELRKTDPAKTILNGKEAYELAKQINYTQGMLESLNFIGVGYRNISDYSSALKFYLLAYRLSDSLNFLEQKAYALINQGNIFFLMNRDSLALEKLNKALNIGGEINNKQVIAYCNINIGRIYLAEKRNDEAIDYITKALVERREWDDLWSIGNTLNKLAEAHLQTNNYQQAISNLNEIIDLAQNIEGGENLMSQAYASLGVLYEKRKNYTFSNNYLMKSVELGQKVNNKHQLMVAYDLLAKNYTAVKDFSNAYYFMSKYVDYKDSVLSIETNKNVALLEIQYQSEAKEKDNELLRKENELQESKISQQSTIVNLLVIIIILIVGVTIVGLIQYRSKQRLNKELIGKNLEIDKQRSELLELNKTKDKFFSIIAHDLKNPFLNLISSSEFISKEYYNLSDSDKLTLINTLRNSAKTSYALLENLLTWALSQRNQVEFDPSTFLIIEPILENIELYQMKIASKGIELVNNTPKNLMVFADKKMIDTVLRNLIGNALKFTEAKRKIYISADVNDRFVTVSVEDSGIGISEEVLNKLFKIDNQVSTYGVNGEKGSGLGLIICKEFIEKNNGKIWVESKNDSGSKFFFTLPSTTSE